MGVISALGSGIGRLWTNTIVSNRVTGPAVRDAERQLARYRAMSGIARSGLTGDEALRADWRRLNNMARAENRLRDRAYEAENAGNKAMAERLQQAADILSQRQADLGTSVVSLASQKYLAPAGGALEGWFTPERVGRRGRDWAGWGIRMGITAGALMGAGTIGRALTGGGGMFTNQYGQFDIAGIPFI